MDKGRSRLEKWSNGARVATALLVVSITVTWAAPVSAVEWCCLVTNDGGVTTHNNTWWCGLTSCGVWPGADCTYSETVVTFAYDHCEEKEVACRTIQPSEWAGCSDFQSEKQYFRFNRECDSTSDPEACKNCLDEAVPPWDSSGEIHCDEACEACD